MAVWYCRAVGALTVLVAVQLSVLGLYCPPVFKKPLLPCPPQTIISLPAQSEACHSRPSGTLLVPVAVQVSVDGPYLPPSFTGGPPLLPAQMILALRAL